MVSRFDPSRLPDFTNQRVVDNHMERLDTKGVSRRDFLALASAGAAAGAAAGALGLPSVGVAATQGKRSFVSYSATSEVNVQLGKALADATGDLGLNYVFLDGKADSGAQLNAFEQELVTGTRAAVFNLADGSSLKRISRLATQNKVFIANVWDTLPWFTPFEVGDYYTFFITPQEVDGYRNLTTVFAQAIVDKFGGGRSSGSRAPTAILWTSTAAVAATRLSPISQRSSSSINSPAYGTARPPPRRRPTSWRDTPTSSGSSARTMM